MFLLVDYAKVLCSTANELQENSDAISKEDYSGNINCFVVDSSRLQLRLNLTFVAFCLLSVIQYNYYVDHSELLTRFRTNFTSSVWNFCR